nr:phosphopantetheine-binding protein [uncultured Methanolobus sp.]
MNTKNWIIQWFEDNTDMEYAEIESQTDVNFLDKAWIDSFKFISFIDDIENEFNIRFSNDQFQDRRFSTVEGLIEIIEDKING